MKPWQRLAIITAGLIVVAGGTVGVFASGVVSGGGGAPSSGTAICSQSLLNGPSSAPGGSVTVAAGNNSSQTYAASTTYYFATGTHTFGTGTGNAIGAATGDTFIGAPSAVLSGQNDNEGAIEGNVTGVTIEYLTIENFNPPNSSSAINNSSEPTWTIEYDTIGPNGFSQGSDDGYGVDLGSSNLLEYNCLTQDGQGGFNTGCGTGCASADPWGGPQNISIENNEISWNGISEYPDFSCGCSGGGKLFWSENDTVTGNWVHDNYNVGLWFDFNNAGMNVSNNYIASNWAEGLNIEASYNASVEDNTFVGNGWASDGAWPSGSCPGSNNCEAGSGVINGTTYGNLTPAIYPSDSGGQTAIASNYSGELLIENNVFTNNWDGIGAFQDRNRYCGSPYQGNCTIDNQSTYTDNVSLGAGDAVENSTTTITSSGGWLNVQTDAATPPSSGMYVFGAGIPANDTISSCASDHTCTLVTAASASASGVEIDMGTTGGCGPYDLNGTSLGNAYFQHCIWNTQDTTVSGNTFNMNAGAVTGCSGTSNWCGFNALGANEGACSGSGQYQCGWSPYAGTVTATDVVLHNSNLWSTNTYTGTWYFSCGNWLTLVSHATWEGSTCGSQDAGSSGL